MELGTHAGDSMKRTVTGFRQDQGGDWVAELSCGHDQDVRHRPPFQPRPWVLSAGGREERLGTFLTCPLCDRAELPRVIRHVRSSPVWDENTLPSRMRRAHRLAAGTWGVIRVREGRLRFCLESDPPLAVELDPSSAHQAIPPDVDHEVQPLDRVRFSVDFFAIERSEHAAHVSRSDEPDVPATEEGGDPACWASLLCPDCGAVLPADPHRPDCPASRG